MVNPDPPLLVIAGPTASGKTALAIAIAEHLTARGTPAEIISCDSVAVYRLLDIGSAKPSTAERARIPHHCLDLYWPDEVCSAGDYARAARAAIASLRAHGILPVVAGGTGLYLRALLHGLAPAPPRDEPLRERLRTAEARHRTDPLATSWLHRLLRRLDPAAAALIHPNDTPKLIRSLEVTLTARQPQTEQWAAGRDPLTGNRILQFGLAPPRDTLYARIDDRAAAMFTRGLVAETAQLRARYGDACRSLTSLGYAQALSLLRGDITEDQAIRAAQQGHRNYAKRQLTWFRRDPDLHWLQGFGDDPAIQSQALTLLTERLAQNHA